MNLKPPLRTAYRPNPAYFDNSDFAAVEAARTTVECVARWATGSEVWPIGHGEVRRSQQLSGDATMRAQAVIDMWNWVREWLTLHDPGIARL